LKDDTKVSKGKVYPLSFSERDKLRSFIKENLESGCIVKTDSPQATPFFLIKKKDGRLCPVQDYQQLNDNTQKDLYPLPLATELLDRIKDSKYFTKLDIHWGYNNI
jgi:hypothetical protein